MTFVPRGRNARARVKPLERLEFPVLACFFHLLLLLLTPFLRHYFPSTSSSSFFVFDFVFAFLVIIYILALFSHIFFPYSFLFLFNYVTLRVNRRLIDFTPGQANR